MGCMKQLNLNVTPEFAKDLRTFMKQRKIKRKSDAIRLAVHELAERSRKDFDFRSLIGLALSDNPNPNPRFKSEDDLWEKG
jgi:hypothetical protein